MKAIPAVQLGTGGVEEVAAQFHYLGWGVLQTGASEDLGTDLFLMARDDEAIDLGLMVGAQVKTGNSWFKEPLVDHNGEIFGWWFREDLDHFKYWLDHPLPHVVILRDSPNNVSYWQELSSSTVKLFRKGGKVLVPKEQIVDDHGHGELFKIATDQKKALTWEGSAWHGAGNLALKDTLRYALLVPRLIAPHPNVGHRLKITPAQALALVVQLRFNDLYAICTVQRVDLDQLSTLRSWDWRFAAAVHAWIANGNHSLIGEVAKQASKGYQAAAASITHAAALIEIGQPAEARATLEILSRRRLDPVDVAWAAVQRARILAECGERAQGQRALQSLAGFALAAPHDATAAAIGGAVASLLFSLSNWGDKLNVAEVISQSGTAASWWRQQAMSWALNARMEGAFRAWTQDRSTVRIGGGDQTFVHLRSVSLQTGISADHSAWRHSYGRLAQYLLTEEAASTGTRYAEALLMLRQSGSHQVLKQASRRLVWLVPADDLATVARAIDPTVSTRTTAQADLFLLQTLASLLPAGRAAGIADWAHTQLGDVPAYAKQIDASFLVGAELIRLLTSLVPGLKLAQQRRLLDWVLELRPISDGLESAELSPLIRCFDDRLWTIARRKAAMKRREEDKGPMRHSWLSAMTARDPRCRDLLAGIAANGDLSALAFIDSVAKTEGRLAEQIIAVLCDVIQGDIDRERKGLGVSFGGVGPGTALTIMNLNHPAKANWVKLLELVQVTKSAFKIEGTMRVLAAQPEVIPSEFLLKFVEVAARIAALSDSEEGFLSPSKLKAQAQRLIIKAGRLEGKSMDAEIGRLLAGGVEDRVVAASLSASPDDDYGLGILASLAAGESWRIASAAIEMLCVRANKGDRAALDVLLLHIAPSAGWHQDLLVADILEGSPILGGAAFRHFRRHPDQRVRNAMKGVG